MLTTGPEICHRDTCKHQVCRDTQRCHGIVWRQEYAQANIEARAAELVADAAKWGLTLRIEQRPLQPLAMFHHETMVCVRKADRGEARP